MIVVKGLVEVQLVQVATMPKPNHLLRIFKRAKREFKSVFLAELPMK